MFSVCVRIPARQLCLQHCPVLMSARLPQFNKARRLVALCSVCTEKPLSQPYSVNSTSRISVLVWMELKLRSPVVRPAIGVGRVTGGQVGTLVRLTLFTCKQVRTKYLTEIERSLDLTVARDLWRTVVTIILKGSFTLPAEPSRTEPNRFGWENKPTL